MMEKPIIFNGEMVRSILAGNKTQTRRMIKPLPRGACNGQQAIDDGFKPTIFIDKSLNKKWQWQKGAYFSGHVHNLPYDVGDMLYVRETWRVSSVGCYCEKHDANHLIDIHFPDRDDILVCPENEKVTAQAKHYYKKSHGKGILGNYCPGIHMLKWAARIWLEVTGIRAERIQDITEADAQAEGMTTLSNHPHMSEYDFFASYWSGIYGRDEPKGWNANPWVWVIEFKIVSSKGN